jgi:hypothetical protein
MKKLFKTTLFAAALFAVSNSYAQDTTVAQKVGATAKKVGHATAKTAKKVGTKTSEIASKGASGVVDKKYAGKVAPGGQTIYIDKNSAYYYVNKKGHRVYVPKAQLVDKPSN